MLDHTYKLPKIILWFTLLQHGVGLSS